MIKNIIIIILKCLGYLFVFAGIAFIIPIIINELYKKNNGYMTLWEAKDVLQFYGTVLTFVGTVLLGRVTLLLSKRNNDINERLVKLEEVSKMPVLKITKLVLKYNPTSLSKSLDGKSQFYRMDDAKIQQGGNTAFFYDSYIQIHLNNISNNMLCDTKVDKAHVASKNDFRLFVESDMWGICESNIIKSNDEFYIRFYVTNDFFNKFIYHEYKTITVIIHYNDILCNTYEEYISFGLSTRYGDEAQFNESIFGFECVTSFYDVKRIDKDIKLYR